jgi:hypothetical protein
MMDEEVVGWLLSGITVKEFWVLYVVGIVGIVARFLFNLWEGIAVDSSTPYTFQFRYFIKGMIRIILSLIFLAVVVARYQEFSHLLVDIELPVPTRWANFEQPVAALTAGAAFILGLGIDEVVKRFVGEGYKIVNAKRNGKNEIT